MMGLIIIWLVCGCIAGIIANKKGYRGFGFFLLGLVLGVFGILWAVAVQPAAPEGMRKVLCARCNARQNVPADQSTYECWQCHANLDVLENK
jgi:uncharacterized membrane protein YeaQ/YmgE (transglycosylase-associated protein family)